MAILLEHTGAQRGVLLIPDFVEDPAGEIVASLRVEADCLAGGPCHVLQAQPLLDQDPETAAAPRRVVNFVVHSRQILALPDVTEEPPFATDPAVLARQVSSLLCLPLRQQRQLIGVLYLENLPEPDAFTTQEGDVLSLLATQAALSVQNAWPREGSWEGEGWRVESKGRRTQEASGVLRVAPVALAVLVGDDEMAAPEGAGEAERWAAARMRQARLHLREGHWTEANLQVDEALALAQQAGDRAAWRPIALGFGPELAVLPGGLSALPGDRAAGRRVDPGRRRRLADGAAGSAGHRGLAVGSPERGAGRVSPGAGPGSAHDGPLDGRAVGSVGAGRQRAHGPPRLRPGPADIGLAGHAVAPARDWAKLGRWAGCSGRRAWTGCAGRRRLLAV